MTVPLGSGVQLVRRSEWGARAPRSRTSVRPTYGSTVHWEGPHMGPFGHDQCAGKVRGIQRFHMDTRGWSDIAYSALVCPHGYAFEGRWVGVRSAANGTTVGNDTAYTVCYLGGIDDPFTAAAQRALRVTLDWLDAHGGAGPGRNCHRDWKPTQCPGDAICTWVRNGQPAPGGTVPPPPSPTSFPGTVRQGDRGTAVAVWQGSLRDWRGYTLAVDGVFGPATNHVVRDFQAKEHLAVDGVAGPATWTALVKYAPRPAPPPPPPAPAPAPTPQKAGKMLWLIKGAERPEWWLTDLLVKRHVKDQEDAAISIWLAAAAGQPVQVKPGNQPHVLGADQQDWIDHLPTVS